MSMTNLFGVRSYLDDVYSTYDTGLHLREVTPAPTGGEPNRLVFLRVDGEPEGGAETSETGIVRPIKTSIERNGTCEIKYVAEFWTNADTEESDHVRPGERAYVYRVMAP